MGYCSFPGGYAVFACQAKAVQPMTDRGLVQAGCWRLDTSPLHNGWDMMLCCFVTGWLFADFIWYSGDIFFCFVKSHFFFPARLSASFWLAYCQLCFWWVWCCPTISNAWFQSARERWIPRNISPQLNTRKFEWRHVATGKNHAESRTCDFSWRVSTPLLLQKNRFRV